MRHMPVSWATPLSLVAAAMVAAGCTSNTTDGPTLTGDWHGYVALHDEYGVPLASDTGVLVTAVNNGHTGPSVVSSGDGSYDLAGLHTGTYTLVYSGAGTGIFLRPEVGFIGGGTQFLGVQNLSTASTGTVTGLTAAPDISGDAVDITAAIGPPPTGLTRYVRLFFGAANTVSSAPASYRVSLLSRNTTGALSISVADTALAGLRTAFGSGNPAYVVGYGDSAFPDSYADTATGNTIYPNVSTSPSNTVAFVVP